MKANNFVGKEGKWFSNLSGTVTSASSLDISSTTTQGIGILTHFETDNGDVDTDTDLVSTPIVYGCMDPCKQGYNPLANTNDGSCIDYVYGCMDTTAFNYNPNATSSYSGCTDGTFTGSSNGTCIETVYGCTDVTAVNYNSNANVNDGSCIAEVLGCTDSLATNYNVLANTDDGTCYTVTLGCIDPQASNYVSGDSVINASDYYFGIDGVMYFTGNPCIYTGFCADSEAENYNINSSDLTHVKVSHVQENGESIQYGATFNDEDCTYSVEGCMDPLANNYNSNATIDDGSCTYNPVYGCTDPLANNHDPDADTDDGSCEYDVYGCTNPLATNYDSDATIDDGSCDYADGEVTITEIS